MHQATGPLAEYFPPIVHDRDKFSNREQSETNRNDENAMCEDKFSNREQSETNRIDENAMCDFYPNIYKYVSDYIKIHHDRFCIG